MSAITAQAEPKMKSGKRASTKISLEDFLRNYSDMEDGYKYEWNNGIIEKTNAMDQTQFSIQDALFRKFIHTETFKKGGLLTSEGDMRTLKKQLRRPDLAIYTGEQLAKMKKKENQIAPWVGEVISENDQINPVKNKVKEYFKAGVKVVWLIFPKFKEVEVYTSPVDVKICRGKTKISAAPAIPDFELTVNELFA